MDNASTNNSRTTRLIVLSALGYFVVQVSYFILYTPAHIPPDETFHLLQALMFYWNPGFYPPGLEDLSAWHGTGSRNFYLYHLLMGKALHLKDLLGWTDIFLLRVINGLFAFAYIGVFIKLAKLTLENEIQVALAVVIHSSVLMFSFISGAINHDNLTNLISIISIYFFARFEAGKDKRDFFAVIIFLGLGGLTKQAFLPLAAIIFLLAFAVGLRSYPLRALLSPRVGQRLRLWPMALLSLAVILGAVNVVQHAKVIADYGQLDPSCSEVYSHDQCMREHGVYKKYNTLSKKVDESEILRMDPIRYFLVWTDYMLEKAIGIFAYSSWYQGTWFLSVVEVLLVLALLAGWGNSRISRSAFLPGEHKLFAIIVVFYTFVLAFYVNYSSFVSSGLFPRYTFVAVQGRYVFPVLSLIIIILVRQALSFRGDKTNGAIALLIGLLLIANSFPAYLASGSRLTPNDILQERYASQLAHVQRYVHP